MSCPRSSAGRLLIAGGGRSDLLGRSPAGGDPAAALTTEQLTRLLDSLREGEGGVKHGLGEKVNFEVTLLKAVEASRSRAIDSLIKELAALAGESPSLVSPSETSAGDAGAKKKA